MYENVEIKLRVDTKTECTFRYEQGCSQHYFTKNILKKKKVYNLCFVGRNYYNGLFVTYYKIPNIYMNYK